MQQSACGQTIWRQIHPQWSLRTSARSTTRSGPVLTDTDQITGTCPGPFWSVVLCPGSRTPDCGLLRKSVDGGRSVGFWRVSVRASYAGNFTELARLRSRIRTAANFCLPSPIQLIYQLSLRPSRGRSRLALVSCDVASSRCSCAVRDARFGGSRTVAPETDQARQVRLPSRR